MSTRENHLENSGNILWRNFCLDGCKIVPADVKRIHCMYVWWWQLSLTGHRSPVFTVTLIAPLPNPQTPVTVFRTPCSQSAITLDAHFACQHLDPHWDSHLPYPSPKAFTDQLPNTKPSQTIAFVGLILKNWRNTDSMCCPWCWSKAWPS